MKTSAPAHDHLLESEFFSRADTLWEQLQHALMARTENGSENSSENAFRPLTQVRSDRAYNFLLATAERVFTHELVRGFLNSLRQWGKEKLDASHVSTPQVHVYVKGCHRDLVPDAVRTQWHYLYSLTRSGTPSVRLLGEDGLEKKRFWIALSSITNVQLRFNQLLVHETCQAYGLEGPRRATEPLDGAILLHGYLW